jgi:DNA-binding winged helix-turn-helix (wHTH) protein
MRVNSPNTTFLTQPIKILAAIGIAFCIFFFLASFITDKSKGEAISKRVNIAVRAIAHDLLLRAGDSTSSVPPVIEKSNGVFLLAFRNDLIFQPDTLVEVVRRFLAKTSLTNYTVTVYECHKPGIVYGFEINPPDNSIMPCLGRVQPKSCYTVEIAFADFPAPARSYSPIGIMISGIGLVIAVLLIGRSFGPKNSTSITPQNIPAQDESDTRVALGRFEFNSTQQNLRINEETIPLTDKECKILTLLHRNLGQLTLRDELIQAVWTDEGVITGRSLDMFISKLRKKLSADPNLRISNVHGKGYRLEVVSESTAH